MEQLLCDASKSGNFELVKQLIAKGVNINGKNNLGNTPIALASCHEHLDIVKFLLDLKADVNVLCSCNYTALHWAGNNLEINKLLIENKADPNVVNCSGWTPFRYAIARGNIEVVKLLYENGATLRPYDDIELTNVCGSKPFIEQFPVIKYLIEHEGNINACTYNTILHIASQRGCVPIIEYLIDRGADRNIKDYGGKVAADRARTSEVKTIIETYIRPLWSQAIHSWRANQFEKQQIEMLMLIYQYDKCLLTVLPFELILELFSWLVR